MKKEKRADGETDIRKSENQDLTSMIGGRGTTYNGPSSAVHVIGLHYMCHFTTKRHINDILKKQTKRK